MITKRTACPLLTGRGSPQFQDLGLPRIVLVELLDFITTSEASKMVAFFHDQVIPNAISFYIFIAGKETRSEGVIQSTLEDVL